MLMKVRELRKASEEGFTLLELMIVVVIIGILAAIAIPIFANQQKGAAEATLKSDLKNAATAMMTEAAKNSGKFPNSLPGYTVKSPGNALSFVDYSTVANNDPKLENTSGWSGSSQQGAQPPTGNSILLTNRDHFQRSASITVNPGDKIQLSATVRRVKGDIELKAGIWQPQGSAGIGSYCAPFLTYPLLTDRAPVVEYSDGWATYENVVTVPARYSSFGGGTCTSPDLQPGTVVSPFFQIEQGSATIPNGTTQWELSNVVYRNLTEEAKTNPAVDVTTGQKLSNSYCIEGRSQADPKNIWHISTTNTVPTAGECS